jgi:hypothetical protein
MGGDFARIKTRIKTRLVKFSNLSLCAKAPTLTASVLKKVDKVSVSSHRLHLWLVNGES